MIVPGMAKRVHAPFPPRLCLDPAEPRAV